ncbi:hypothetical protein N0V84_003466 [Fusarium piperis]|uniref:Uncharacterized protein n=1 Tax=Fusarium piperis TaxID=1435070 RepID=A0A9W8WHB3_9HYPO|nr:hypothetical protein N0V84_003466 [Fusarium piperis]
MEDNRPGDAGEQSDSSVNPTPHPAVDITRTKQWVSVRNPAMLNVTTAVTHNNMEVEIETDMCLIKADVQALLKAISDTLPANSAIAPR